MTYRKLQELPPQSLPREKLLRQGRHSLSNAELLAIFLRMGIKGKNVLDMSSDLIQSAGSLDALAHMEAAEIANICKGIGMAKAATLSAAFELGARALRETLSRQPIQTPEDVYDYLTTAMRWKEKETVLVLLLDTKCRLIKPVEISSGTLNESIAHPQRLWLHPCPQSSQWKSSPQPYGRPPDRTRAGMLQIIRRSFSGSCNHW